MTFLSRALKCSAEDLQAAFEGLGLSLSENKDEKTEPTVIGDELGTNAIMAAAANLACSMPKGS